MSRDPWAEDWEDDWTSAAKAPITSSELWSQANCDKASATDFLHGAPNITYKPNIQILKRDAPLKDSTQRPTSISAEQAKLDKAAREARYKAAREKLFGSDASRSSTPDGLKSLQHSAVSSEKIVKPERQARGPSSTNRGGFGNRNTSRSKT